MMKAKIKTWEQMEKEFGLDEDGVIKCDECFLQEMEEDMPDDRIIEINDIHGTYIWNSIRHGEWRISDDMIEEIIDEEE